jgi:hypothetical protein
VATWKLASQGDGTNGAAMSLTHMAAREPTPQGDGAKGATTNLSRMTAWGLRVLVFL